MDWKADKLKPTQPFFVLNTSNFKQEIYLKQGISHFYSFDIEEDVNIVAVPDGCIDILFESDSDTISCFISGTVLKVRNQALLKGKKEVKNVFGVRFMPGNKPAGIEYKHKDLVEQRIDLTSENYAKSFVEKLASETDFYQKIRVFLQEYTKIQNRQQLPEGKERLVLTIKDMVYNNDGIVKISDMAKKTGYSERYINRVFIEEMGFSPKTFCKIIQFQRSLEFLNYGAPEKMTDASVNLGYYDQSQFIRDFKSYCGITPKKYLKLIEESGYSEKIH